ncbi:DUF1800 domain-containing protein [Massilia sp. TWP1-3-3]|uniref:DUF1800 domain-containing protein n=1 Tax=Massilia sp. TWP1-3-3 TaxID=2804573 RepID=UPI003CFA7926
MRLPFATVAAVLLILSSSANAAPSAAERDALHVLNRVAYGPAPGDVARVAQMGVQRYIASQLAPQQIAYPAALAERLAALDIPNRSSGAALAQLTELRRDVRDGDEGAKQRRALAYKDMARETAEARLLRALYSPRQLEEVMVDFWFNHFNVFSGKGITRALVAGYERDAIRPNVFGSFRAMLGATARHPAMLFYLDNHLSKAGAVNENYARELMELHTLGVDGGYTQKDVTELARMLTGWTFAPAALARENQAFRFDAKRHDQQGKTWLGSVVAQKGEAEGEYALDVLARHPATARHIAYKLAQYFVQDEPPAPLVERLARSFHDSDGDIRSVLRTLFASDEFMAPASVGAKFKTPYRYVVSAARAGGGQMADMMPLLRSLNEQGMPLYGCATPDGYKNTEAAWLNPAALTRRIAFAGATGATLDAAALEDSIGVGIGAHTRAIVAGSPVRLRAAMLLGSPEFMQH